MPYSIMLDAGHGGRDPGAVYKERKEKDDTLRLTLAVGEILEAHGGRWDLNPHERNAHKILSLARLPVPTLPHIAFLGERFLSRCDGY